MFNTLIRLYLAKYFDGFDVILHTPELSLWAYDSHRGLHTRVMPLCQNCLTPNPVHVQIDLPTIIDLTLDGLN